MSGTLNSSIDEGSVDNFACAVIVTLKVNLYLHKDQLMALLPTSKNAQQCDNPWASGMWTSGTLNGTRVTT